MFSCADVTLTELSLCPHSCDGRVWMLAGAPHTQPGVPVSPGGNSKDLTTHSNHCDAFPNPFSLLCLFSHLPKQLQNKSASDVQAKR